MTHCRLLAAMATPLFHGGKGFLRKVMSGNAKISSSSRGTKTSTLNQKILPTFFTPKFSRDPSFKTLQSSDKAALSKLVSSAPDSILDDSEDVIPFCTDWLNLYRSVPLQTDYHANRTVNEEGRRLDSNVSSHPMVVKPSNTNEVSSILRYCHLNKIAVCPQGGNTGLVGGSIPVYDELVISMSKMSKILSFDTDSGVLICEAGCVLESLNRFLAAQKIKYMMPLDLGAKGSCQIGGNVSTNAGGTRFLRYGALAGNVLGLEVVLADGTVLNSLSSLRKDNTGQKLYQLFIGSEGYMGIITKVAIRCFIAPTSTQVCLMKCDSFASVLSSAMKVKKDLSDILSALEFFDQQCLTAVLLNIPKSTNVLDVDPSSFISSDSVGKQSPQFYLLIETHGQDPEMDKSRILDLMERLVEDSKVNDGVLALSDIQAEQIWMLRESVSASLSHEGRVYKYDLTLPLQRMYEIVEATRERLSNAGLDSCSVGYGHLGDCNLHLNVLARDPSQFQKIESTLEPWIYEYVCSMDGSISAEHGIGLIKADKMHMAKSKEYMQLLKRFKLLLDPNRILNPYKILRPWEDETN